MYNPQERPEFDEAWGNTTYRVLMAGCGDDTTKLIAAAYLKGYEFDEVVFCDTGSEFPHTYKFIEYLKKWMEERNWSKLTVLKKLDRFNQPLSVISLCQSQNTLPAAAFGLKSCSLRFKSETADKHFNNDENCWEAWGIHRKGTRMKDYTGKILRVVGLNADEPEREAKWRPEAKYIQAFPLFDWDIGEDDGDDLVEEAGLYLPGKSSCTICPNMTAPEWIMLRDNYPIKFQEAKDIEANYIKHNMRHHDLIEVVNDRVNSFVSKYFTFKNAKSKKGQRKSRYLKIHDPMPESMKAAIGLIRENCDVMKFGSFKEVYPDNDLIKLMKLHGVVKVIPKSTTTGMCRSMTIEQKIAKWEASPKRYSEPSKTDCGCGD